MAHTSPYDPGTSEARSSWLAGLTEAMSIVTNQLGLKESELEEITLSELPIDDDDRRRIYQADTWNKLWLTVPTPIIKMDDTPITPEEDGFTIDYLGGSIAFEDIRRPKEDVKITATVKHILGGDGSDRSEVLESIKNQLEVISSTLEEKAVKTEVDEQIQQLTESIDTKTSTLTQGLETANQTIESNKQEASQALQDAQAEIEESLQGKADLVDGKVNPEQLPEMNYDTKGSAEAVKTELTEKIEDGLATKQNTLSFDKTPTAESTNPVESQGIKSYVDGEVTKAKNEASKAVNNAKSGEFDVTLTVAGWNGGTEQTVENVNLVMDGYNYIISSDPENWLAYNVAGVHGMDMTEEGKMTFQCTEGETPEQELVVHLMAVATKEE